MKDTPQKKYAKTKKGKEALSRAQQKYDKKSPEKRRTQKKEYMRQLDLPLLQK